MAVEFDELDELKRDREIEGSIGILLKVFEDVYLDVLCQSDANPGYRMFGASKLREVKRQYNAGATPEEMDGHWAAYFFDCRIVKGWEGVVLTQGGDNGPPQRIAIPFNRANWIAWAKKHPRVLKMLERYTDDETNFRARAAEKTVDQLKNSSAG